MRAVCIPQVGTENDTCEMHWELSPADSQKLLNLLFPDEVLFLKVKGVLVENKSDHFTMDQVLMYLVRESVYNEKDKHWSYALKLDAKDPTACEGSLPQSQFFNHVIEQVHILCEMVTVR